MGPPRRWRSVLFVPANRPELLAKVPRVGADVVVLDLEDAVPQADKAEARALAKSGATELGDGKQDVAVLVRINAPNSEWFDDDIAEALWPGLAGVMVPKLESLEQATRTAAALDIVGRESLSIVAGIETAQGVADARPLLSHPRVVAGYFGAEDFVADMSGTRLDDNIEVAYARAQVALGARLGGAAALDMAVTAFGDEVRFRRESSEARGMGYSGKLCIHPSQVALANAAFVPSLDEINRASSLVAAYEAAIASGHGAVAVEGQMVDEPLVKRARAVLSAAELSREGSRE